MFRIIRGKRILDQYLEYISEDTSFNDLYANIERGFPKTTKRQFSTDTVRIVRVEYLPYAPSKKLLVEGLARNNGKVYSPTFMFSNVEYEQESTEDNITFIASDGEKYNIQPLILANNTVKVKCDCLDFYYRFAWWNARDGSLQGKSPPPYQRKTKTRPPVNPDQVPGVCKHLIKLTDALVDSNLIKR